MPPVLQDIAAIAGVVMGSRSLLQWYLAISTDLPSERWEPLDGEPGGIDPVVGGLPSSSTRLLLGLIASTLLLPVARVVVWLFLDYTPVAGSAILAALFFLGLFTGATYLVSVDRALLIRPSRLYTTAARSLRSAENERVRGTAYAQLPHRKLRYRCLCGSHAPRQCRRWSWPRATSSDGWYCPCCHSSTSRPA